MKRNFILLGIAAVLMIGLVVFAFIFSSNIPILQPQGIVAAREKSVLLLTIALCAIVVIPVFIMLFAFAWKFRAGNSRADIRHSPNWDHDSWWTSEFVWWLVPSVIIVVLSIVAWESSHQLDPYVPLASTNAPIQVEVIALDWKWLFIYPDLHIATVYMLEFPENTPVHFSITSDAPMNSFWIPSLGGQIMAMPGMTNQLNLMASKTGEYNGLSGNLSGSGFSGMTFIAKSVSQNDFNSWVSWVQQLHTPLTTSTYQELSLPSTSVPPMYFSSVDSGLYTASLMKYMAGSTSTNSALSEMSPMQTMP